MTICVYQTGAPETDETRTRLLARRFVESLIVEGRYDLAIDKAYLLSQEYGESVATACMRAIIDRQLTNVASHRPAHSENLFAAIYSHNDADAHYFLRCGAEFHWSDRHWLRLACSLFASADMPRTICHLVENALIPATVGFDHFLAALNSTNSHLTVYLSRIPSINQALLLLSDCEKERLNSMYMYNKVCNLRTMVSDVESLRALDTRYNICALTDDEFLKLVRCSCLLQRCTDSAVLSIRNFAVRNAHGDLSIDALGRDLANLVERFPAYGTAFARAARECVQSSPNFTLGGLQPLTTDCSVMAC